MASLLFHWICPDPIEIGLASPDPLALHYTVELTHYNDTSHVFGTMYTQTGLNFTSFNVTIPVTEAGYYLKRVERTDSNGRRQTLSVVSSFFACTLRKCELSKFQPVISAIPIIRFGKFRRTCKTRDCLHQQYCSLRNLGAWHLLLGLYTVKRLIV